MTNSQIVDSVQLTQYFTVQGAPSQTIAMLNAVMTETLGMGMHNAISAQQQSQMTGAAATTSTCARILSVLSPKPGGGAPPTAPTSSSPGSAPAAGPAAGGSTSTPAPASSGSSPSAAPSPSSFGLPPSGSNPPASS